jgi:hypothetical protein
MENQASDAGYVAKRIIKNEDLPPDLLDRAVDLPETRSKSLFEWVMEVRASLNDEQVSAVDSVLNDGVLISAAGSDKISREAATLTSGARLALKDLMREETKHREQATFVLAMDVQNRVHNEVQH